MKNLKENSICVSNPIVVRWPQFSEKEETIDMTNIGSKFNGAYCTNNSTICFVVDHEVFVTPYTREAMSTIRRAGFTEKYFYVPFSNWDYPKHEKAKWFRLLETAHESSYRDYEDDCAKWCDQHGIGELNEETLKRCFKMPREGVHVKYVDGETTTYYPACGDERYLDLNYKALNKLGCYCSNNGKVVFVHHDGHTYVTKGRWVLDKLIQAGYKKSSYLFVPFSNWEKIVDPYLAYRWEQIPEK